MIAYDEAYRLTLAHICPLGVETVTLLEAGGRVTSQAIQAQVDSPSVDVSLKDGYALMGAEVRSATPDAPAHLRVVGSSAAGGGWPGTLHTGEAVRILSGAPLPKGADAVVSEEYTRVTGEGVDILNHAGGGRNILPKGTDIGQGRVIVPAGQRLAPTMIGLLAAAGFQEVQVNRRPRVAVLGTGDEVLAPGEPMAPGKLYASNMFTLASWCRSYGFEAATFILRDDEHQIREKVIHCLETYDAILTSGGAWKGERDLVVHILDGLGWEKVYHRVRLGPGKAVGFGVYQGKPVFCLPGGPPSNHMAFLQLGLPGLQQLAGEPQVGLAQVPARLAETIQGQVDWTQGVHGRLERDEQGLIFQPIQSLSRLQEMADAQAVALIPEGAERILAGSLIWVQVISPGGWCGSWVAGGC